MSQFGVQIVNITGIRHKTMNLTLTVFITIVLLYTNSITSNLAAHDLSFTSDDIPSDAWEQHSEGVAVSIKLGVYTENGIKKHEIRVYLKNTSNTIKEFPRNDWDSGIEIFYMNSSGIAVPLHDYSSKNGDILSSRLMAVAMKPNATLLVPIDVNDQDATLLKTFPVKCQLTISDSSIGKTFTIETSPRILIETVE